MLYTIYTGTSRASHVSIITSVVKNPDDGTWRISTTDAGGYDGHVTWSWDNEYGAGAYGMHNKDNSLTYRIFTRYPE